MPGRSCDFSSGSAGSSFIFRIQKAVFFGAGLKLPNEGTSEKRVHLDRSMCRRIHTCKGMQYLKDTPDA